MTKVLVKLKDFFRTLITITSERVRMKIKSCKKSSGRHKFVILFKRNSTFLHGQMAKNVSFFNSNIESKAAANWRLFCNSSEVAFLYGLGGESWDKHEVCFSETRFFSSRKTGQARNCVRVFCELEYLG